MAHQELPLETRPLARCRSPYFCRSRFEFRFPTSTDARVSMFLKLKAASSEALASFGDGSCFIERYIKNAKHVEVFTCNSIFIFSLLFVYTFIIGINLVRFIMFYYSFGENGNPGVFI